MNRKIIFISLAAGISGTAIYCLFFYLTDSWYQNPFLPDVKSLDFFIYVLMLVAVLILYRFVFNKRVMRFWEGLFVGLFTGTIMIAFSILFMYYLLSNEESKSIENYIRYETEAFESQKEGFIRQQNEYGRDGKDIYEKSVAEMRKVDKVDAVRFLLIKEFWQKIILVVFVTLIAAAVLRN